MRTITSEVYENPHPDQVMRMLTDTGGVLRAVRLGPEAKRVSGTMMAVAELDAASPSTAIEPLADLSSILERCIQMRQLGFVSPRNVCQAMAMIVAMQRTIQELEQAVGDGNVSRTESVNMLESNLALLFGETRFRGSFEEHLILANTRLVDDAVVWNNIDLLIDDRLAYRVLLGDDGQARFAWTTWDGSDPTSAETEWFEHTDPRTWADPPSSLVAAAAVVRRFMGVLGTILGFQSCPEGGVGRQPDAVA